MALPELGVVGLATSAVVRNNMPTDIAPPTGANVQADTTGTADYNPVRDLLVPGSGPPPPLPPKDAPEGAVAPTPGAPSSADWSKVMATPTQNLPDFLAEHGVNPVNLLPGYTATASAPAAGTVTAPPTSPSGAPTSVHKLAPYVAPPAELAPVYAQAEKAHDLPDGLLSHISFHESSYNSAATNKSGATGLMGFMPATVKNWADKGFHFDPNSTTAVDIAGRQLAQLSHEFHGNLAMAIAAYNSRPKTVHAAVAAAGVGGNWISHLPEETQNYVNTIMAEMKAHGQRELVRAP